MLMMTQNADKKREQVQLFCTDDMAPWDCLLRIIGKVIDWFFIYKLVEDKYSQDSGCPSMDPVILIKTPFIQYLYDIKSMRQTVKEIEVDVAYRWLLGLDMLDKVPHFSTFGKDYAKCFKDIDLFEQIFAHILPERYKFKLVDPNEVFVDATHVKARANSRRIQKRIAHDETLFFKDLLKQEINEDRETHGKRPLKEKENSNNAPSGGAGGREGKTVRASTSDPGSRWFRRGEHKHIFTYAVQTACDKNGQILNYGVHPGNNHDSRTFKSLCSKTKGIGIRTLIADIGYKTPGTAKLLINQGVKPLLPYKCPLTKEGFFKRYEYVYNEHRNCYICPSNQVLTYRTTNREGYCEYRSCGSAYTSCAYPAKYTQSKGHVETVMRHMWEPYMETYEEIRQTLDTKKLYSQRKGTIERVFGSVRGNHGFRYTRIFGRARVEIKVKLTFACMNLKKLARVKAKWGTAHSISLILNAIWLIKESWFWDIEPKTSLSTV